MFPDDQILTLILTLTRCNARWRPRATFKQGRQMTVFQIRKEKRIFLVPREFIHVFAYSFGYTEGKRIVRKTVQEILMDKGFDLPSVAAQHARKSAGKLLERYSDSVNQPLFESFAAALVSKLRTCFKLHQSAQRGQEHLCITFSSCVHHQSFKKWSSFLLESIGEYPSPLVFQYVTERTLETMIKCHYQFDKLEKKH